MDSHGHGTSAAGLDHPRRRAIYALVQAQPGLNRAQVVRRLDFATTTTEFHLEQLENAGLISRIPVHGGTEKLIFASDDLDLWHEPTTRVLFGYGATRHVAVHVLEHPGQTAQDLADALNRPLRTIHNHLTKLQAQSLVRRVRDGLRVEYHPLKMLRDWHQRVGRQYPRPRKERATSRRRPAN